MKKHTILDIVDWDSIEKLQFKKLYSVNFR